jgi:hypothetical protein
MASDCTMVHYLKGGSNNIVCFFLRDAAQEFRGAPLHKFEYELQEVL